MNIVSEQNLTLLEGRAAFRQAQELIIEACLKQAFHQYKFYPQAVLASTQLIKLIAEAFEKENFLSYLTTQEQYAQLKLKEYLLNLIQDQAVYTCECKKSLALIKGSRFAQRMLNHLLQPKMRGVAIQEFQLHWLRSLGGGWSIALVESQTPLRKNLLFL